MRSPSSKVKKSLAFVVSSFAVTIALYTITAFSEFPVLSECRDLWIETAMTTGDHQWLAKVFPESVIEKTMSKQVNTIEGIAGLNTESQDSEKFDFLNFNLPYYTQEMEESIRQKALEMQEQRKREEEQQRIKEEKEAERRYWHESDPLHQKKAAQTGVDDTGRKILYNDIEQGIMISLIESSMYTARIVQICDPSRVIVASTNQKGSVGQLICDYLQEYNAIVGINASGFNDPNGNGMGGEIIGKTRAQGEDWGDLMYGSMTIGFDESNRLLAGVMNDWDGYDIRDAIQFGPVLIKDGEILTEGSAGWGLQPRTIIAQRSDGAVMFLVVDGRKPGYSIGATMGDCAEVLSEYGAITAAACDGGSSSVLAYNGAIINDPSTPMSTGRYLPNVFLVKRW